MLMLFHRAGININFAWISRHVGIVGYELTGRTAKAVFHSINNVESVTLVALLKDVS